MPLEPRSDRLSRKELEVMQSRALRSWTESDWLAEHNPRAWTALETTDPTVIVVDLSGGLGESNQVPGAIVLGNDYGDRRSMQTLSGEERVPDIYWNLNDGLPFEDQAVDTVHIRRMLGSLAELALARLPKELARVLVVGGTVFVVDAASRVRRLGTALEEQGFEPESIGPDAEAPKTGMQGRFVLHRQKRPLAEVQPHLIEERDRGDLVIREPRQPYRR